MRKVETEYRIPSFPCNANIIEFVFASDVLAFLIFSPSIVYCFSEEFRSMTKILQLRNDSSLGTSVELLGSI